MESGEDIQYEEIRTVNEDIITLHQAVHIILYDSKNFAWRRYAEFYYDIIKNEKQPARLSKEIKRSYV